MATKAPSRILGQVSELRNDKELIFLHLTLGQTGAQPPESSPTRQPRITDELLFYPNLPELSPHRT